jgi:hypothetical protein
MGDEAAARLGSGSGVPLKCRVATTSQPRASAVVTQCQPLRQYEFPRSQCGSTQRRFCGATTGVPGATRERGARATTKQRRGSAAAARTRELSRGKPLEFSSQKVSAIVNRRPYAAQVCPLVGSSLTLDPYSPFLLWRAKASDTGPNCAAVRATVCQNRARPGASEKASPWQPGGPGRRTLKGAVLRMRKCPPTRRTCATSSVSAKPRSATKTTFTPAGNTAGTLSRTASYAACVTLLLPGSLTSPTTGTARPRYPTDRRRRHY